MDRFLVCIIGIPLAFLLLYYRKPIKDFIGEIAFAEKIFGMGGTYTFLIFLAFFVFLGSLMYAMGTLQTLVGDYLGPIFGKWFCKVSWKISWLLFTASVICAGTFIFNFFEWYFFRSLFHLKFSFFEAVNSKNFGWECVRKAHLFCKRSRNRPWNVLWKFGFVCFSIFTDCLL